MIVNHISVSTLPVLYRFGGAIERRIMETANEQARRGHDVHVYSVGDQSETKLLEGVIFTTFAVVPSRRCTRYTNIYFAVSISCFLVRNSVLGNRRPFGNCQPIG